MPFSEDPDWYRDVGLQPAPSDKTGTCDWGMQLDSGQPRTARLLVLSEARLTLHREQVYRTAAHPQSDVMAVLQLTLRFFCICDPVHTHSAGSERLASC